MPRVTIGVSKAREDIIKDKIKIGAWQQAFSVNRVGIYENKHVLYIKE